MDNMRKMCEDMMKQDNGQMTKMFDQMPFMKEMCKAMFESNSDEKGDSTNCDSGVNSKTSGNIVEQELKPLFDEWVNQIKEEVSTYISKNPNVSVKEIADHFKLSEECMAYFMKNRNERTDYNSSDQDFLHLEIKKTKNSCSLCEDYVRQNDSKPVVVACCEGACLRGEIARKAANLLCHSLIPDKTVRLCLGSALTKEGGQRNLLENAKKIIVLEGCPVDCGSRMICGLGFEKQPEVIRTDILADFDKNLFGINELTEEEVNKLALSVAKQIANII